MLPSVVSGSVYPPVVRDVFAKAEMQAIIKTIEPAESVVKTADDVNATAQADEVLSNWDEQLWWDQAQQAPAVQPVVAEKSKDSETLSAAPAAGFFGAFSQWLLDRFDAASARMNATRTKADRRPFA